MEELLDAHRRSLTAMREACARNPGPHANQLAALDRELELAAAGDLDTALAAGGGMFELTRGAWLDRLAGQVRVAVAVGDPWLARAAAAEHAHALRATGHGDWGAHLAAGGAEAAPLQARGADARAAFHRLQLGVLTLESTADAAWRDEIRSHAASALAALREADPAFAWSRLEEQPRYGLRVPWTGDARAAVGDWIGALGESAGEEGDTGDPLGEAEAAAAAWRAGLARRGDGAREPAPVTVPSPAGVAAGYRALADAAAGEDRASAATRRAALAAAEAAADAPTGPDAVARLTASGLLAALAAAPLRARAEEALERQRLWPEPLVAHHWRALLAALDAATTATEVEAVSTHAQACIDVEADWNAALLGGLLAPLRAAALEGAAGLERAALATARLTGLGPHEVTALPRVDAFLCENLHPRAIRELEPIGAHEGESGFDTVNAAREWLEQTGARPGGPGELRDALLAAAPELVTTGPRPVSLWGRPVALGDLAGALARPGRPPVPGLAPIPGAASGL